VAGSKWPTSLFVPARLRRSLSVDWVPTLGPGAGHYPPSKGQGPQWPGTRNTVAAASPCSRLPTSSALPTYGGLSLQSVLASARCWSLGQLLHHAA